MLTSTYDIDDKYTLTVTQRMITVDNGNEKTNFVPSSNQVFLKHVRTKAQSLITLKNTTPQNNSQQEKSNIMAKIKEVQLDNESKRRFISTQKMSGEEARAHRIERDNLRQHHSDLKVRLIEAESRKENIQPDLYKETSKVDDKFKDFVSRLREVAKEVFDNEDQHIVNQVAELNSKNEDFSQNDLGKCRHAVNLVATRIDVKFSKLLANCHGARSKCEEACRFISKCNETIDKIGIETARSTTQFQHDFDDIRKDLHQANLEIDCLLQKANLISESVGKLINERKELLNRNAEIKMKYDQKKVFMSPCKYDDIKKGDLVLAFKSPTRFYTLSTNFGRELGKRLRK